MKIPSTFYNKQLKKHQLDVKNYKKKLIELSLVRFLVFLVTVFSVYFSFQQIQVASSIGIVGLAIFLFLLKKYSKIKSEKELSEALITINEEELKIASGDYFDKEQGLEFQNPKHYYSLDIDLFGRGSFYQFINRTSINEGSKRLADELTANDIENIVLRQGALKELASIPEWRQNFSANASLVNIETPAISIINWLKKYNAFLPTIMKWLPIGFAIVSAVLLGLTFTSILSPFPAIIWMLIGLGITGKYLKKITALSSNSDKVKDTFRQYSVLLEKIENKTFTSEILKGKQQKITSEGKKASLIFSEFSKLLDALDSRNNIFFAIVGNGFLLWDCKQSYKIEQWIQEYNHKVEDWFDVISFFDAYNSLGNFVFNHPNYIFPEITTNKTAINTKGLGHPLLNVAKRIDNDLSIDHEQFFIITGANMA